MNATTTSATRTAARSTAAAARARTEPREAVRSPWRAAATSGPPAPAEPFRTAVWTGPAAFTKREIEVLECQSLGKKNREIARALHVTTYTVMSHLCRMYTKADAANGAALVAAGFRRGVLRPRELPTGRAQVLIEASILQMLPLVAAGYSNAQIATRLYISLDTVKYRMRRLRRDLGAHSRAHLVRAAVEHGLLALGPSGAGLAVGSAT